VKLPVDGVAMAALDHTRTHAVNINASIILAPHLNCHVLALLASIDEDVLLFFYIGTVDNDRGT
jgi:hypothetical protein